MPPTRPQPADLPFLAFAQSVELAIVNVYDQALGRGLLSVEIADFASDFQRHHRDHGQSFSGIGGRVTASIANQSLVTAFAARVQSATNERDVLQVLLDLETASASTYTVGLGQIVGTDPAYLVASILPIESRHAVVIGEAMNLSPSAFALAFESTSAGLTREQYPFVES
jgi:hypothetical protein